MKITAVIPARYGSSRFPGKPLQDICGKPMIWWVYNQVKKSLMIDKIIVATDDKRIADVCSSYNLDFVMTASTHGTSTERVFEVANKVSSDLYLVINGDEPLIDPKVIEKIIPSKIPEDKIFVSNLMTEIKIPSEVIDFTNIKVVTDYESNALFMSRSPIPYPKASLDYKYYKHVGVLIYNFAALKFFAETKKGYNEKIEDVNEIRFIENGVKLHMVQVESNSLSVDTPKDLEVIRNMISEKIKNGGIVLE